MKWLLEIADNIMRAAQLAAILEVSATPKPGNVHRNADYPKTRFEHFLAGAVAIGPTVREAALQGAAVASGQIKYGEIGIGRCLRRAVLDLGSWHSGGNTHLGICMLFLPLSAAAGLVCTTNFNADAEKLRKQVVKVMETTTFEDAVEFSRAVSSYNVGWLGRIESPDLPDLSSKESVKKIATDRITLFRMMEISSKWDEVASELTNGMHISFTKGYPMLVDTYRETGDINTSIVNTYLKILSEVPDTFIARKVGLKETNNVVEAIKIGMPESLKVSKRAKKILEIHDGMLTEKGRRAIWRLDEELRSRGGLLNPGSTADVTASSLMIALLTGFRF